MTNRPPSANDAGWDTGSRAEFYRYYAAQSEGEASLLRFRAIRSTLERMLGLSGSLDVADIGCGAGTQCRLWAERGHRVHGADINAALVELGRQRAQDAGLDIRFEIASATDLPWPDCSMDLCIAPELLEHVEDWEACIAEFVRILRPGGALYLSTSNLLCPRQQEFTLPLYSWYPPALKRYCVHLARTTRPQIAGHAIYPAVNWFTFYQLRTCLQRHGMRSYDRFDMVDLSRQGRLGRAAIGAVRSLPPLRWCAHVLTPYLSLLAVRQE